MLIQVASRDGLYCLSCVDGFDPIRLQCSICPGGRNSIYGMS